MTIIMTRDTKSKSLAQLIVLAFVSSVCTLVVFSTMFTMGGLGHGIESPIILSVTPFTFYQWPVLVVLANASWSLARISAKIFMALYYVWILYYIFHYWGFGLEYDFYKLRDLSGSRYPMDFIFWALAFLLIHLLIWLPGLFWFNKRREVS